ncbi:hypothetical protein TRFO_28586 [Tritrichomonas foetus]|uniref:Guanylate cyclase domain-containing protein n=1 Tax=Tritrichomonas foetus TaxID=1144522 RepID=A0A1J4JZ73_9EUKA|nr:hypothetical protein TRFO_28586 [Tritrichomonas foetus]|eukprot:OHT03994.1 hypothetical protein TRFO_28586 [Tritrichomonas foetus]
MRRRELSPVPTSSSETIADLTMPLHILRFSSVLDISIWVRTFDSLIKYFAKIHASTKGFQIIGYAFFALFFIQTLFPSILINSTILWPQDSVITNVFQILEVFWDGPSIIYQSARIYVSLILSIIYILSFIFLFVRAYNYSGEKTMGQVEVAFSYILFKYVLLILLPLLLSGFPYACYQLSNSNISGVSVFVVIFVPIVYVLYLVFLFSLFSPRVLLENTPMHEFISSWASFPFVSTSICSMLSTCLGFVNDISGIVFPLFIMFLHGLCFFFHITFPLYPHISTSISLATVECTATIISIIQAVNLYFKRVTPEIIMVVISVLLVLLFLLFRIIYSKKIHKMMLFCDECMNDPIDAPELMEKEFRSPIEFLSKLMLLTDKWHPYLYTWKFFEYATSKWPNSFTILYTYGKLVSFFPQMNSTMLWICSQISKLPSSFFRTTYLRQFSAISQSRQKSLTRKLQSKLDDIRSRINILLALLRRFWGNVLQKNTSNFWEDSDRVIRNINEIDDLLYQLTKDFPNNHEVWNEYYHFVLSIKHDLKLAHEIANKIQIISKNGQLQPDTAMSLGVQVFPNIQLFLKEYSSDLSNRYDLGNDGSPFNFQNISNNVNHSIMNASYSSNEFNLFKNKDADHQLDLATQELIEHSKLGRVWVGILFCTIMTGFSIFLFFIFTRKYRNAFINRQDGALKFMSKFNLLYYHIAFVNMYVMTYPLFLSNQVKPDRSTMDIVAPNLYTVSRAIPVWQCSIEMVESVITEIKNLFSEVIRCIHNINSEEEPVKKIINLLSYTIIYNNMNLENSIIQILSDIETMLFLPITEYYTYLEASNLYQYLNNSYEALDEIFRQSIHYSSKDYDDSFKNVNELMVATLMLTLLLVTLPFMLQLFGLQIQNEAISNSFAFFPNSEIRSVITKFGMKSSKIEADVTHVAILSHKSSDNSWEYFQLSITFFCSFVPLICGCLTTYFMATKFMSDAEGTTLSISTLYMPFTELIKGMEGISKTFAYDRYIQNSENRTVGLDDAAIHLDHAHDKFSSGMWSSLSSVNKYYEYDHHSIMDNYSDCFSSSVVKRAKSLFETFITNDFPFTLDLIQGSMKRLIINNYNSSIPQNDNQFLSLLFWFTNFSDINRNKPYFSIIENSTEATINLYRSNANIVVIVVVVFQVISCILIVFMMLIRHFQIRNVLRFYQDISSAALAQNHYAMYLITTGKNNADRVTSSFARSDAILTNIPQGVFLADKELIITDVNPAFRRMVNFGGEIKSRPLTEVVKSYNLEDHSWPDFIQNLTQVFTGKCKPQFNETVNIEFTPGIVSHLQINVVSLTDNRPALEGEWEEIIKVAVIIEDCTEEVSAMKKIEEEQKQISKMLSKVLPKTIINDIEAGEESVAFVTQSVTIGFIQIFTPRIWETEQRDILPFYNQVFDKIDKILNEFDLLCKVRTVSNMYMYTGGLFSKMNKPDKHADQACKFALRVMSEVVPTMKSTAPDYDLTIGIHSGGPVVAGIMSITRPSFQIIGPVTDCAQQLAINCMPGKVQVSRSVYELIFSSGFRVFDKGDTNIRGGNSVQTYIISQS